MNDNPNGYGNNPIEPYAGFKQALEALPGAMEPIIKTVAEKILPIMQNLADQLNATGYHITYNHPATKHDGRRRSRREMRDTRQQVHFIPLAQVVRKRDGER